MICQSGMLVREATLEDAAAIGRVQVASWRHFYAGILPDAVLAAQDAAVRAGRWASWIGEAGSARRVLVGELDGAVAGFAAFGPGRDPPGDAPGAGELYAVYLAPEAAGRGLGRAMMGAAEAGLAAYGAAFLWVLEDNARARRFYEAAGWEADGEVKVDPFGDETRRELRYRRRFG